jgi:hypothetical protein
MAVASANVLNYQATDADHRAFATGIHNLLIAAGLTQTADTGQANLATITRPATNASSGFEVFRFNDAEQATLPLFIRVSYGSAQNSTNVPGMLIAFGTGTNGAGVLTNSTSPAAVITGWTDASLDSVGTSRPAFVSYAEGQFVLTFGMDASGGRGVFWYLGRPRAFDGSRTTDGFIWFSYGVASGIKARVVYRAGGGGPSTFLGSSSLQIVPDSMAGQDDQVGGNVALWPMYVGVNGNLRFGSLFGYRAAAILIDAQQDVNVFGGLKTYRAMGVLLTVGQTAIMVPYF